MQLTYAIDASIADQMPQAYVDEPNQDVLLQALDQPCPLRDQSKKKESKKAEKKAKKKKKVSKKSKKGKPKLYSSDAEAPAVLVNLCSSEEESSVIHLESFRGIY